MKQNIVSGKRFNKYTKVTLPVLLSVCFISSCGPDLNLESGEYGVVTKRTVYGYVKIDGVPQKNIQVAAWDEDSGEDEHMSDVISGKYYVTTDSNGYYKIHYKKKKWDNYANWTGWHRPDIYIRVKVPEEVDCKYIKGTGTNRGRWVYKKAWRSGVKEDHKQKESCRIDANPAVSCKQPCCDYVDNWIYLNSDGGGGENFGAKTEYCGWLYYNGDIMTGDEPESDMKWCTKEKGGAVQAFRY